MRKLGIPTVLDRVVQQAVQQVLQKQWDPTFSEHSYGFRPGRSAHQAVAQAQQYIAEGYGWCVDFDLEKFFDRVNHDRLMGAIAKRVEDKRLLKREFSAALHKPKKSAVGDSIHRVAVVPGHPISRVREQLGGVTL